jgi:hypothetical protein
VHARVCSCVCVCDRRWDLQVLDSGNCKLPDYYLYKAPTCACGDDPVRIPAERRNEGLDKKAHWCTGTLRMTDGFGKPMWVLFVLLHLYFDSVHISFACQIEDFLSSLQLIITRFPFPGI